MEKKYFCTILAHIIYLMAGVFTKLHAGAPQVLRFAEISPDQPARSITRASSPHLNVNSPPSHFAFRIPVSPESIRNLIDFAAISPGVSPDVSCICFAPSWIHASPDAPASHNAYCPDCTNVEEDITQGNTGKYHEEPDEKSFASTN